MDILLWDRFQSSTKLITRRWLSSQVELMKEVFFIHKHVGSSLEQELLKNNGSPITNY
jgi:hypothetical protein